MALGVAATAELSVGERAYSLALRSLADTKDTLIMVCVALLGALDRLQERLHLPSTLVKELKRKLAKMIDTSSAAKAHKLAPEGKAVGERLAESDMWDRAEPEEIRGVVQWAVAVVKYLNRLMVASTLSVCRGIFILIMRVPGVSTACALFYRVLQLVEDTVRYSTTTILEMVSAEVGGATGSEASDSRGFHHSHHRHRPESYIGDPSMTAVVLEYREKECMVPSNIDQRIRRVMHFSIPLRTFEATVRLPSSHFRESSSMDQLSAIGHVSNNPDSSGAFTTSLSSSSPRSIPVSPRARRRVQLAFSNFSDEVLYQARDRLRLERAATLTGTRSLLVPVFNPHDCNEEIRLSCGRHCATKLGPGMHRSVRGSIPFPRNRLVYFEMSLQEMRSPSRSSSQANRMLEARNASGSGGDAGTGVSADASVCIGVSTQSMPLNSLVGTSRYSVGFYSAGRVLVGGTRRSFVAVNRGYGVQSTVGVLVKVIDQDGTDQIEPTNARGGSASGLSLAISPLARTVTASLRFTVDGAALRDGNNNPLEFTLPFPSHSDLFPTLTLHSQGVQVFGRFSAPDIMALDPDLKMSTSEDVWCLDGQRLVRPP